MRDDPRVRRRRTLLIVVVAVIVVLVVGIGLARVYSSVSNERAAVTDLIEAEARGDTTTMLDDLYQCRASAACQARVAADAVNLRRSGSVTVLELNPSSSFPLGGDTGTARIAWKVGSSLPITQCVRVRHAGDPVSGLRVELLELSARIKTSGDCPKHY